MSPLMRVIAKGDVNLVKELLDLRVEPKVVATLKGQGDEKQRSGLMVPVLITGAFASPKIRPDLTGIDVKGMINGKGLPSTEGLKKVLDTKADPKEKIESVKEDLTKQIKGLLPGFTK